MPTRPSRPGSRSEKPCRKLHTLYCRVLCNHNIIGRMMRPVWFLLIPLLACGGCDDGIPIVLESERAPSPDNSLDAIVERVDNGLGFGQGAVYNEIHVLIRGSSVSVHGVPSVSVVFCAREEINVDNGVTAHWVSARHLVISYEPRRMYGLRAKRFGDVLIDYSPNSEE
jgi:hypothetical protein